MLRRHSFCTIGPIKVKFISPQDIDLQTIAAKNRYYWNGMTNRFWKVLAILIFSFLYFSWINWRWQQWYGVKLEARCQVPDDELEDMRILGRQVQDILKGRDLQYALAFGSLWGALRMNDILPWDIDIDIMVIMDRNADFKGTIAGIMADMEAKGVEVYYREWIGIIQGYSTKYNSQLDIVFYCDFYGSGTMHRCTGWESYFLWINHRYHFVYPAELTKPPLPTLQFINRTWPVPRGGIEIQKYHYRENWWKVSKPKGC